VPRGPGRHVSAEHGSASIDDPCRRRIQGRSPGQVAAGSGKVFSSKHESPKAEAAEKAKEKGEK
jgi:hypothetical protein